MNSLIKPILVDTNNCNSNDLIQVGLVEEEIVTTEIEEHQNDSPCFVAVHIGLSHSIIDDFFSYFFIKLDYLQRRWISFCQ